MDWHRGVLQDVRYACRSLLGRRTALIHIASLLSVGVGSTTAIFALVNALAFQALPVPEPQKLVMVQRHISQFNVNASAFNYPMYKVLLESMTSFDGVLARWPVAVDVAVGNRTERTRGELVSGSYFETLRLLPEVGRLLTREDDKVEGSPAVCVISHQMWRDFFDSDPLIVSKILLVNQTQYTIVGVAPRRFTGTALHEPVHLFLPMSMTGSIVTNSSRDTIRWSWLGILGRLRNNVSLNQAENELRVVGARLVQDGVTPPSPSGSNPWRISLAPRGFDLKAQELTRPALLLLGGAGVLLLITCLSVSGLFIARMDARLREISVRMALGGSKWRVARLLVVESSILGMITAIAGCGVAVFLALTLARYAQGYSQELSVNLDVDWRVLLFSLIVSIATSLAVGLVQAFYWVRNSAIDFLRSGQGITRRSHVVWRALIATQVGFTVLLLFSAGLLSRTLYNLRSVPLGFELEGLTVLSMSPAKAGYKAADAQRLIDTLLSRLKSLPQITDVSAATIGVLSGDMFAIDVNVPGHVRHDNEENTYINSVSPGYFSTLGMSLLDGRDFLPSDSGSSTNVAVVNRSFARHYWPGQSPVGKWFESGKRRVEIVGMVSDTKFDSVRSASPAVVYFALAQRSFETVVLHVRSSVDSGTLAELVRKEVSDAKVAGLSVFNVNTMRELRDRLIGVESVIGLFAFVFALAAAVLSATGVFGLISSLASSRQKEFAIRQALGGQTDQLMRVFIGDGILLAAVGLGIGTLLVLYAGEIFRSIVFEVESHDVVVLACVITFTCALVVLAVLPPARRLLRSDLSLILRHE